MPHYYNSFSELQGKTLTSISGVEEDEVVFVCDDGSRYKLWHEQDCCENVNLAEVIGDLADLIGTPVLSAEEVSSDGAPEPEHFDSYTWTFYKLATIKGNVTLRWLGQSNGYYSERVSFAEFD